MLLRGEFKSMEKVVEISEAMLVGQGVYQSVTQKVKPKEKGRKLVIAIMGLRGCWRSALVYWSVQGDDGRGGLVFQQPFVKH